MTSVETAPCFTLEEAESVLNKRFGMEGKVEDLPSERDRNFLVTLSSGTRYVLKISHKNERQENLDFQNKVMETLGREEVGITCPQPCKSKQGETLIWVPNSLGEIHGARLFTFVEGIPLGQVTPHPAELLVDLGRYVAQIVNGLQVLPPRKTQPEFPWNLQNGLAVIQKYREYITDPKARRLLDASLQRVKEDEEKFSQLSLGLVHNDGNDYNLLVDASSITPESLGSMKIGGIIDFGDITYSYVLSDLAVAMTYALFNKEDILDAAGLMVSGYHRVRPLSEEELQALFPLVILRLGVSVCMSAYQKTRAPENSYLVISEQHAWRLLDRIQNIPARLIYYRFRQACSYPIIPSGSGISQWLENIPGQVFPVLGFPLLEGKTVFLDLGIGSQLFESREQWDDMRLVARLLQQEVLQRGASVGIGGYGQARLFYNTPQFESQNEGGARTIHLGIDLFYSAGSPVFAPLEGTVHSFGDNRAPRDYGPTIILEHRPAPGILFYTLYGHLDRKSLEVMFPGKHIAKGEILGAIGTWEENGQWPPHLHFQLINDLLGWKGDFPGVAATQQLSLWQELSPNPHRLLAIDSYQSAKLELPPEALLPQRRSLLGKSLSLAYRQPLKIVRGDRQFLYDYQGKIYLDGVNNVAHVGHSHPRVVEAIRRQAAVLNTNTRYLHDNLLKYAQDLLSTLPEPLAVCFFVNSGSEANDLALRLAKTYTRAKDIWVLEDAYHGNLTSLIEISPYKFNGPGGEGCPPWVHVIPRPDPYRGMYGGDPQCSSKYVMHLEKSLATICQEGRGPAAFLAEPMMGCGGQIVPPAGFLRDSFGLVRQAGGICIADEVQVGFGRCGTHFWGFQAQDALPDIVTMGKPIGNGFPLGAVVTTRDIADAFANGMEYFNTFGGNPVSCAAGIAVLQVLRDEQLQSQAFKTGRHLQEGLLGLQQRSPLIGDIRGMGLFWGIELVLDREKKTPAVSQAKYIVERFQEEGILVSTDGPDHNVLKLKPPMVFSSADVDRLVTALGRILKESPLNREIVGTAAI